MRVYGKILNGKVEILFNFFNLIELEGKRSRLRGIPSAMW